MEDQEPYGESHTVGGEVETLREHHLLRAVQPQDPRLVAGQLAGAGERDAHADGDGHERQRLLEQVRPSLAFPGPPAHRVAHGGACEPSGCPGDARRDVEQLAHQVGDLGGGQREYRGRSEPDQPPAAWGAQPAPQGPGNHAPQTISGRGGNRRVCGAMSHEAPRLAEAVRSLSHGIQYENRRWPGHQEVLGVLAAMSQAAARHPYQAGQQTSPGQPPPGLGATPAGRQPAAAAAGLLA
jgi:hypothetical protein